MLEHQVNSANERLRKDGFRVFSSDENYIFIRCGQKILFDLVDNAFRYSYFEAKILGIGRQEMTYRILNDYNRFFICKAFADSISNSDAQAHHTNTIYSFTPTTDEQIQEELRKKYNVLECKDIAVKFYKYELPEQFKQTAQ